MLSLLSLALVAQPAPPLEQAPNTWVKRSPLANGPPSPGLGYEGWFFHRRRIRPIREFEPDFQRTPRDAGYVSNFLFR